MVEGREGEVGDGDEEGFAVAGFGLSGVEREEDGFEAGEGGGGRIRIRVNTVVVVVKVGESGYEGED